MEIENIAIIGKFSDGKIRQIVVSPLIEESLLNVIVRLEGHITVLDKELEGIEINTNKQ